MRPPSGCISTESISSRVISSPSLPASCRAHRVSRWSDAHLGLLQLLPWVQDHPRADPGSVSVVAAFPENVAPRCSCNDAHYGEHRSHQPVLRHQSRRDADLIVHLRDRCSDSLDRAKSLLGVLVGQSAFRTEGVESTALDGPIGDPRVGLRPDRRRNIRLQLSAECRRQLHPSPSASEYEMIDKHGHLSSRFWLRRSSKRSTTRALSPREAVYKSGELPARALHR